MGYNKNDDLELILKKAFTEKAFKEQDIDMDKAWEKFESRYKPTKKRQHLKYWPL